ENTPTNPKNTYGKSKSDAEKLIIELETDDFKVAILRPPMVYGEGCKGNYQLLRRVALVSPIFPDFKNKRSMIHIDVLSKKIERIIVKNEHGIFCPQDTQYVR